jgi:endonuclease YncB( thermonuclease family)
LKKILVLFTIVLLVPLNSFALSDTDIPEWIKNNAKWWSVSQISDRDFIKGLEYLMQKGILKVPQSTKVDSVSSEQIPSWLRNNASWWSQGLLSDEDFVKGIQYLTNNGIIRVTSNAESLCSGDALCVAAKVERIVDGDTIYIEGYKIRLSLANTPERNESGFSKATEFTKKLCPVGSVVIVDQDDKQPYDIYDRLLGKVYCNDKILNSELLSNGYANILTQYCSNSEFSSEPWAQDFGCRESSSDSVTASEKSEHSLTPTLTATAISPWEIRLSWFPPTDTLKQSITGYLIEREIIEDVLYDEVTTVSGSTTTYTVSGLETGKTYSYVITANLSEGDTPRSNSVSATTKTDSEPTTSSQQVDCDPSYPDFCIPPPPPDLDCKDIPQKRFTVLQPDPHRFDGDKDGIGCES